MRYYTILFGFLMTCQFLLAQDAAELEQYEQYFLQEADYAAQLETLRSEYGKAKKYPSKYELACLTALSFYPELKDIKIEFVEKKIPSIMRAQPKSNFVMLFQKRKKRIYKIVMSSNEDPASNAVVGDLSFNALVGVLGHELAHVVQYLDLSLARLIFGYPLSKKFHRSLEQGADQITIDHGLGYGLFELRCYSMYLSGRDEKKNATTLKYYYGPERILEELRLKR